MLGSSPNVGMSFLNFILFIFVHVVLARTIITEIVLANY
jgi:hypothetical protein